MGEKQRAALVLLSKPSGLGLAGTPGTKPLPWRLWAEPGEGVAGTRLVEQGGAGEAGTLQAEGLAQGHSSPRRRPSSGDCLLKGPRGGTELNADPGSALSAGWPWVSHSSSAGRGVPICQPC